MNYRSMLMGGALLPMAIAGASALAQAAPGPQAQAPAQETAGFRWPPEYRHGDWSIRLRGRVVYDVGHTENPNGALPADQLGSDGRLRRLRLGVQGSLPGNFSYRAEGEFSTGDPEWIDLYLQWTPNKQVTVKLGNQNSFQSLEQPTSSLYSSFMERPQFVEAYGQTRLLGASAAWSNGRVFAGGGLFSGNINAHFQNAGWLAAARGVFMPRLDDGTQLHFGASYQHRNNNSLELGARYRARPNPRLTDLRFIDTGTLAVSSGNQLGLEAIAIHGPLHLVGEAGWLWTQTAPHGPGAVLPDGAVIPNGNASFFGYYLEAGYYFTGETRGYKTSTALWDSTKVKKPLGKGGFGALSGNIRWDMLDLTDESLLSGGVNTRSSRGGRNAALSLSLIWEPVQHVRLTTQYTRNNVKGGPYALRANGLTQGDATAYGYKADVVGARFSYDF